MHRTIFVAVSSLHFHLVEVVNAENVHVSSKGSSRHGDFANCGPPSSYAGMCDALKQCGTLNLNLLNIQIENSLCWTQVWLGMTSRKDQGQYWYNKIIPCSSQGFCWCIPKVPCWGVTPSGAHHSFWQKKCHPAALVTKKYALSNWEILQAGYAREKLLMNAFVSLLRWSGCTFLLFSMKCFQMTEHFMAALHCSQISPKKKATWE
jgi:hypothetical protein